MEVDRSRWKNTEAGLEVDGSRWKVPLPPKKKSVLHREVGNTYILYVYPNGQYVHEHVTGIPGTRYLVERWVFLATRSHGHT